MNILPKKRWHVRTKENIARVRRDEAKAAAEEKDRQERIKLAEREARARLLSKKAQARVASVKDFISLEQSSQEIQQNVSAEHINFFNEVEEGTAELKKSNKEHDKEQKEEQEKYEKQIGYLTYLGQDTNEILGKDNWYNIAPNRSNTDKGEVNMKSKILHDPLEIIKKFTDVPKNKNTSVIVSSSSKSIKNNQREGDKITKHINTLTLFKEKVKKSKHSKLHKKKKSHKRRHKKSKGSDSGKSSDSEHRRKRKLSSSSISSDGDHRRKKRKLSNSDTSSDSNNSDSDSDDDRVKFEKARKLELLRMERIKREQEERKRSEPLLAKLRGEVVPPVNSNVSTNTVLPMRRKYNSQFNPELAKQNY